MTGVDSTAWTCPGCGGRFIGDVADLCPQCLLAALRSAAAAHYDDPHPVGCDCPDCAYWCDGNQDAAPAVESPVTSATATLAAYQSWQSGAIVAFDGVGDWQGWADRLAAELQAVMARLAEVEADVVTLGRAVAYAASQD